MGGGLFTKPSMKGFKEKSIGIDSREKKEKKGGFLWPKM
jgi:hypothetical protein